MYRIFISGLRFKRTDPLEDPLIAKARRVLSAPLPYQLMVTNMESLLAGERFVQTGDA